MKIRVFPILAVTAMLAALLSAGGLVYADSHADAQAEANGTSPYTDGYACDDSYAEAMANAAGNIDKGVWDEDLEGSPKATAIANATSDAGSYVYVDVHVWGDYDGDGWITGTSTGTAVNGGTVYIAVNGIVSERDSSDPKATVTLTATAVADGEGADADVDIGEYGEYYEWDFESYWGGGIDEYSSGTVNIDASANTKGYYSDADTEVDEVGIFDGSTGNIRVIAATNANGTYADAYVDIEEVMIDEESTGNINLDALSTATGEAYAEINGVYLWINDNSSGNIDAVIRSTASSGGHSYASADSALDNGDRGNLVIYSIANANGSDSYANSDVEVWGLIPAGAYYDVASDDSAFAIALLISDGTNVWAISYTDAQNGGAASADVWSGEGTGAEAMVGADIKKLD
ncbi:MAG: hypothetical protein ACRKGH_04780 [Dehalogenimonas sp.]